MSLGGGFWVSLEAAAGFVRAGRDIEAAGWAGDPRGRRETPQKGARGTWLDPQRWSSGSQGVPAQAEED